VRRVLVTLMAIIGGFTMLTVLAVLGFGVWLWQSAPDSAIADASLLKLELAGTLPDIRSADPVAAFLAEPTPGLRDAVEAIDRAAVDGRISGLVVDMSQARPSLAAAQELRAAIKRFRAAGKYTAAFADSFSENERATQSYYLASAFERIWMQPSGSLDITGFRSETPFFADLLKNVGVLPEFFQRHEFKGASDSFRLSHMDPNVRKMLTALLEDLHRQTVEGLAESRKLDAAAVSAAIARAPLFADEALDRKLIDRVGYRDQMIAAARQTLGGGNPTLDFARYAAETKPPAPAEEARVIAVIGVRGPILRGKSPDSGLGGDRVYGDSVAESIDRATRDRRVAAILLRIDSPGGSYVASDTIWRSVKMARAAGKKVVASMGGVAASGGYFVAMAADQIIAEPATITGSIGVISGKFVVTPLLDKLGVNVDSIETAPNAGFYSLTQSFTPDQRVRFDEMLDRIYADFTTRVATDRKISPAKMDSLARGRVWTGAQAVELGLVDGLGGMEEAVAAARKLAELPDAEQIPVVAYPPPEASWKRFARGLQRMEDIGVALGDFVGVFGPSLAFLRRATVTMSQGTMSLGGALDFEVP